MLNPGRLNTRAADTQLTNNCLGTVLDLRELRWTGKTARGACSGCNIWTSEAFAEDCAALERGVADSDASTSTSAPCPT